eukprot:3138380-Rhodomonas_salina.1
MSRHCLCDPSLSVGARHHFLRPNSATRLSQPGTTLLRALVLLLRLASTLSPTGTDLQYLGLGYSLFSDVWVVAPVFEPSLSCLVSAHVRRGRGEGWWRRRRSVMRARGGGGAREREEEMVVENGKKERGRERERQRQRFRHRHRHRHTDTDTKTQKHTKPQRHKDNRHRQRDTDRERHTRHRQSDTDTDTDTERGEHSVMTPALRSFSSLLYSW